MKPNDTQRILILGLNFSPELTGIGRFTGEMALYLAGQGIRVRAITTPPYYPYWKIQPGYSGWQYRWEQIEGVEIIRCPLWVPKSITNRTRIPHLLSFAISSLPAMLLQASWKPDIVLCVIPTLFSAPAALLVARLCKAKAWLHIQDFELEAAFKLKMLPGIKRLYPLVHGLESGLLTHFDMVSTISERMLALCIDKGVSLRRIFLLPNWVDTQRIYPLVGSNPLRDELHLLDNQIIILYHGNMGRKQGLGILLDAADYLQKEVDIQFILCGEGVARSELEARAHELPNVRFLDVQPENRLNALVNLADIHVLPQLAGVADLVMPSKLTGMLASGKAVIATAHAHTEVGRIISKVGVLTPPEDPTTLAEAILSLARSPERRSRLGKSGREYALQNWEVNIVLKRFEEQIFNLLEQV